MSQQSVSLLNLAFTATAIVADKRFVKTSGAQCLDGERAQGVSLSSAAIGAEFAATTIGTAVIEAGGIFSKGAELQSDLNGKAIVKAAGAKNAVALQESTGAGDFVEVLVLAN